jgi:hypothetical protein
VGHRGAVAGDGVVLIAFLIIGFAQPVLPFARPSWFKSQHLCAIRPRAALAPAIAAGAVAAWPCPPEPRRGSKVVFASENIG